MSQKMIASTGAENQPIRGLHRLTAQMAPVWRNQTNKNGESVIGINSAHIFLNLQGKISFPVSFFCTKITPKLSTTRKLLFAIKVTLNLAENSCK